MTSAELARTAIRCRSGKRWLVLPISLAAMALTPSGASAIVMGTQSSLHGHTVRIVDGRGGNCSGVVIARRLVATAAHCAQRRVRIVACGQRIAIAGITRHAVLDDGRRVRVRGDAALLRTAAPLAFSLWPPPIGEGAGDTFVIAGYGTAEERHRGAFGVLREATLVSAGRFRLVDPHRQGRIGASACHGDSGGPVLRGGMLVGVVTRAVHPSPRIACGHITRWAPMLITGMPTTASSQTIESQRQSRRPRKTPKRRGRRR